MAKGKNGLKSGSGPKPEPKELPLVEQLERAIRNAIAPIGISSQANHSEAAWHEAVVEACELAASGSAMWLEEQIGEEE